MAADERVFDAAKRVLDQVVTRFATAGVALPSRQFVHAGFTAHDCEQVAIEVTPALHHGFPGNVQNFTNCQLPRYVAMNVVILRCVPLSAESGDPPTATELENSAKAMLVDAWHLADAVYRAYEDGSLDADGCTMAAIGSVAILEPGGGIGGVSLGVEVQV